MPNWAIVIGIDQYWQEVVCLNGAVRDALLMRKWLLECADVEDSRLHLLLSPSPIDTTTVSIADGEPPLPDSEYHRATQANLNGTLKLVRQESEGIGERLYFFYSGHGVRSQRNKGEWEDALITEDFTEDNSGRSFWVGSVLRYFAAATQFKDQFFFIDACRSIEWDDQFRIGDAPVPEAVAVTKSAPQQFVFNATSPGVEATEFAQSGEAQGAFTRILLGGLRGEAKSWDQSLLEDVVRVDDLSTYFKVATTKQNVLLKEAGLPEIDLPRQSFLERGAAGRDSNPIVGRIPGGEGVTLLGLLTDSYWTIAAELSRITALFKSSGEPFRGHADDVRPRFDTPIGDLREKVSAIATAIREGKPGDGWNAYGEARGRLLPALANDLLAAIGGFYILDHELDDASVPGEDNKPLSFSMLAQNLVKDDLKRRTSSEAFPVLIVGEERLDVGDGDAVIRLRFPAWDIWNLPLTAREYGYLLSRKAGNGPRLSELSKFCDEVIKQIDPSTSSPRPGQSCFIPEVDEFLSTYEGLRDTEMRKKFIDNCKSKLALLKDQQHRFVCRLFADAFATVFGGPTYLYALLYLRFWPNEVVSADTPRFADRFLFALEILRRMSDKPKAPDPGIFRALFDREINRLQSLWSEARKVAPVEASDEEIQGRYSGWVDKIYGCFEGYNKADLEETYKSWKESESLEEVLMKGDQATELASGRPSVWAVLNAAWRLRLDRSLEDSDVIRNALRLLDKDDMRLIQSAKGGRQSRGRSGFGEPSGRAPSGDAGVSERAPKVVEVDRFDKEGKK